MVKVTAEQLRDFQLCRYLYQKRYIERVVEMESRSTRDRLVFDFEDALSRTIKNFYFELMSNNEVPTLKSMLSKWEKIWFKDVLVEDIMSSVDDPGKNKNSYNTDAHAILNGFYMKNSKNPGKVVMLDEIYEVPLTDNTKIVGTVDVVLNRQGKITMPHYTVRNKTAFNRGTLRFYKMIFDSIAYRHKSDLIENNAVMYLLKTGKEYMHVVDDLEIKQVRLLADELADCTRYYPTENYWCRSCQFSDTCWKWE